MALHKQRATKFIHQLLDVPSRTLDEQRRTRSLNVLVLGFIPLAFLGFLVVFIGQLIGMYSQQEANETYIPALILLPTMVTVYAINRYWSQRVASILFLLLLTASFFFLNTPFEAVWGYNTLSLALPVLIASLILSPNASFIMAGIISGLLLVAAALADFDPNFIGILTYFALALVAWLSARSLEKTVQDLHTINTELDQLVEQRTAELQASNQQLHRQNNALQKAETALRQAHNVLEKKVAERTAELAFTNTQLQQEITERKRVEAQIKASLQEKEVLLKEIHHRVKNNMQVISSLLDLQTRYIEDAPTKEMMQESRSRIRSMALVHEQLYQSENLARIDFSDYVRSLMSYLLQVYRQMVRDVTLDVNVAGVALSIETAVPLGLIIHELVSNALKHAFPNGRSGQIRVHLLSGENDQIGLTVQDNGIGFPKEMVFRRSPSFGMAIITTLVDQLRGEIEVHSQAQSGTRFELTCPVRDEQDD